MKSHELTPNEIKGMDLAMRVLKGKFPFLTGEWEPVYNYMEYDNTLFINVGADINKVSDYIGVPIRPYPKKRFQEKDMDINFNGISYSLEGYLDTPKGSTIGYDIKKNMNKKLNTIYEDIPKSFHRMWTHIPSYDEGRTTDHPVHIVIMDFIFS